MLFNVPNSLTWARILLIPLFVGVFYVPHHWLTPHEQSVTATAIFILAAVTDWFDGYLARTLGQTSAFGAFLDPVADKLMVAAALLVLVQLDRLDALIAFIIIGREIAISALREWMAKIGRARSVASPPGGGAAPAPVSRRPATMSRWRPLRPPRRRGTRRSGGPTAGRRARRARAASGGRLPRRCARCP